LLPIVARLESSLLRDTCELQSTCADILASGSVEQVSYLFDPLLVLDNLAKIDRDALDKMEKALLQSSYFPGSLPVLVPQARPSNEIAMSEAGPSSLTKCASSIVNIKHLLVVILTPDSPAQEVSRDVKAPEEDELAMSEVEDTAEGAVRDAGKDATEDASEA